MALRVINFSRIGLNEWIMTLMNPDIPIFNHSCHNTMIQDSAVLLLNINKYPCVYGMQTIMNQK